MQAIAYQRANPRPTRRTLRRYLTGFLQGISNPLEIAQWGAVAARVLLAPGPDVVRSDVVAILDARGPGFARRTLAQLGLEGLGELTVHAAGGIIDDLAVPAYGALRGGWRTRAALEGGTGAHAQPDARRRCAVRTGPRGLAAVKLLRLVPSGRRTRGSAALARRVRRQLKVWTLRWGSDWRDTRSFDGGRRQVVFARWGTLSSGLFS